MRDELLAVVHDDVGRRGALFGQLDHVAECDDVIAGFDVLSSNETPGFGDQIKYDYYRNQFKGAPAGELKLVTVGEPDEIDSQIVAISGATISREAVVEIVSNYVTRIKEQMLEKGILSNGGQ